MHKNAIMVVILVLLGSTSNGELIGLDWREQGRGAKALGIGGSFVSVADDPWAIYWNPAGLGKTKNPMVLIDAMMWHNNWTTMDITNRHYRGRRTSIPSVIAVMPICSFAFAIGHYIPVEEIWNAGEIQWHNQRVQLRSEKRIEYTTLSLATHWIFPFYLGLSFHRLQFLSRGSSLAKVYRYIFSNGWIGEEWNRTTFTGTGYSFALGTLVTPKRGKDFAGSLGLNFRINGWGKGEIETNSMGFEDDNGTLFYGVPVFHQGNIRSGGSISAEVGLQISLFNLFSVAGAFLSPSEEKWHLEGYPADYFNLSDSSRINLPISITRPTYRLGTEIFPTKQKKIALHFGFASYGENEGPYIWSSGFSYKYKRVNLEGAFQYAGLKKLHRTFQDTYSERKIERIFSLSVCYQFENEK
ncbi:MAG: hypothetical protein AB1393_06155 [Candidatus Edwardsbacteria bacterium]